MLVHTRKTVKVICHGCKMQLIAPIRSELYDSKSKPSTCRWFFDWYTTDSFGWQEYLKNHLIYKAGKTFEMSESDVPRPHLQKSVQTKEGTMQVVPSFGKSVFWVCGDCVKKPLRLSRDESLAHLGR